MGKTHRLTLKKENWMRQLAFQYGYIRKAFPEDRLMIVFDIDGTILDTRPMVLAVLRAYDERHGTAFSARLAMEDLSVQMHELFGLLGRQGVPVRDQEAVASWCMENFWQSQRDYRSCRPFNGVLDVIRWFQLQPGTSVGLNTGRDETLRGLTLGSLNAVAREHRVEFTDRLLFMNSSGDILRDKAEGIRYFEDLGYRVFAMVDNEPANLRAVAERHRAKDILLLHAETLFESSLAEKPEGAHGGDTYDITELIREKSLPPHIQFVWHGVNDGSILRQFLASNVRWAEFHVRLEPGTDRIIARRRRLEDRPLEAGEKPVLIEDLLSVMKMTDRGVKLDIKDTGITDRIIRMLRDFGFEDDRIWISSSLYRIQKTGVRRFREEFPGAIIQTPVDLLTPMVNTSRAQARGFLGMLEKIGFNRFSVNWKNRGARSMVSEIQDLGLEVNIYNVPDLEAFLQAVLLMPTSITSYFNFPKWFYYGMNTDEQDQALKERKIA